ncbi:MAG: hypothetical protein HYZ84_04320 [Candidatus Omnitrophica bacterium]|nr:hypothetical protein [Candidatus Omnitrophota bacterium]
MNKFVHFPAILIAVIQFVVHRLKLATLARRIAGLVRPIAEMLFVMQVKIAVIVLKTAAAR